jgi:hypothetical protein
MMLAIMSLRLFYLVIISECEGRLSKQGSTAIGRFPLLLFMLLNHVQSRGIVTERQAQGQSVLTCPRICCAVEFGAVPDKVVFRIDQAP